MLNLIFNLSWIYDILLLAIVGLLLFFVIKEPKCKVYVFSIFAVAFLALTSYSAIELNYYYKANGGIFGQIKDIVQPNKVTLENTKFEFENIVLVKDTDNNFSAEITIDDIVTFDKNSNYTILINDLPCTQSEFKSNYLMADFRFQFINDNEKVLKDDTLKFRFSFNKNNTYIKIYTSGGQLAADYWLQFFDRNGLIIELKKVQLDDELSFIDGEISDFVKIEYYVEDEIFTYQSIKKGEKIKLANAPVKENHIFLGWLSESNDYILEDYVVVDNMKLHASFKEARIYSDFVFNGGYLEKYVGVEENVVVPASYSLTPDGRAYEGDEHIVFGISMFAFENNDYIKSITFPSTITTLESRSIYNCNFLSYLVLNSEIPPELAPEHFCITEVEELNVYVPDNSLTAYLNYCFDPDGWGTTFETPYIKLFKLSELIINK